MITTAGERFKVNGGWGWGEVFRVGWGDRGVWADEPTATPAATVSMCMEHMHTA